MSPQTSYVKYLKFQVLSFYGEGGGLQHLSFHGTSKLESKKVGFILEKRKYKYKIADCFCSENSLSNDSMCSLTRVNDVAELSIDKDILMKLQL